MRAPDVIDSTEMRDDHFDLLINENSIETQQKNGNITSWQTHHWHSRDLLPARMGDRVFQPDDLDTSCACYLKKNHTHPGITDRHCNAGTGSCRCSGNKINLGNWGILYGYGGTITNCTNKDVNVAFHVRANTEQGIVIAYWNGSGWTSATLPKGSEIAYYTVAVNKGSTANYSSMYVLGGPSGNDLKEFVTLEQLSRNP